MHAQIALRKKIKYIKLLKLNLTLQNYFNTIINNIMHGRLTCFLNILYWDNSRGNPSIINPVASLLADESISVFSSDTVISGGTSSPRSIVSCIIWPCSVFLAISPRSNSPAQIWTNPNSFTILEHWVPLPLPGPPRERNKNEILTSILICCS